MDSSKDSLAEDSLEYHRFPKPGKLAITATKPLSNQRDLSLAYSPGVAAVCTAIEKDPSLAADYTSRSNLVAVISNGTAVLGLGNIGALASKPVMEGKAVLFKAFADIDVFDLEINANTIDEVVNIVAALEPSFGGINLEDIKAPECFEIERRLVEKMNIPVFHDDQHGTAIIVTAATINAMRQVGKELSEVKLVTLGAGAAAIACLNLLVSSGVRRENVYVYDRTGLIYEGRNEDSDPYKDAYMQKCGNIPIHEALEGADIFLGLSAANALQPEWIKGMRRDPLIMALANPTPEIMPDAARAVRPDALVATGRSDFPNQVNNVLCFPFLFRGALDVGATTINEEMKIACAKAIAALGEREAPEQIRKAYGDSAELKFGKEYFIPKPFDPRLIIELPPAVAEAAMRTGVATRPIANLDDYRLQLSQIVNRSGMVMKPVFERVRNSQKRVIYAEGEDERVLRAVQTVIDEGIAQPIICGRRELVENRIEKHGLRMRVGKDLELIDPFQNDLKESLAKLYHQRVGRDGVSPRAARYAVQTRATVLCALMLENGHADAMVCGTAGQYSRHHRHIKQIIGNRDAAPMAALTMLVLKTGTLFLIDTHVATHSAAEMVEVANLACEEIRCFGMTPKVAFVSHSNFGTKENPSSLKMAAAARLFRERYPDVQADGEMHADAALDPRIRAELIADSPLEGAANLLVMPDLDAANITYNALKVTGDDGGAEVVGPILLGAKLPVHILTSSATSRSIIDITAIAVLDAIRQG